MLRKRFKFDLEQIRIDMTARMALACAVGLIVGVSMAVTWAYAYGRELVTTADEHRDRALIAYPTWPQVLQVIREERQAIDANGEERQKEVLKRLERIEDRLMRK